MICNDNNNNCEIEVEDNFLLESLATCPSKQSDLVMYFTVNTAFMHYFGTLTDELDVHILQNGCVNRSYQFHSKHLILIQNY